ncbi:MAG: PRD domain-containing protein [Thermoanaerobacteraceae bacterium]|nr:PRD domain-containing protein [Thermoanaerobacteraceae bacterium]
MKISERIEILFSGGVIDEEVMDLTLKAVSWLEKRNISLEDERGHMFLTHFAMSLQRIKKGEQVETLDSYIMDELQNSRGYAKALDFVRFMEKQGKIQLPESEKAYILLHLCNLFGKE